MEVSRVLKAHTQQAGSGAAFFNFEDLRRQGQLILEEARGQADQLLAAARAEADQLRKSTQQTAHAAGYAAGMAEAKQAQGETLKKLVAQELATTVEQTLPILHDAARLLSHVKEEWLHRWERGAIELSLAIAETLVRRQLQLNPARATQMVREALQLATGHAQLQVHLHPDDLARLGPHANDIVRNLTHCAQASLVADPGVEVGGCLIETSYGAIDARLPTMLERIASELLDE